VLLVNRFTGLSSEFIGMYKLSALYAVRYKRADSNLAVT